MAEIERKHQKVFAGSLSPSGNIAVYGSKLAGTPAYSDNLDNIQSSRWLNGIMGATSSDKAPYVQDLNAIFYAITKQLAYLFQAGVSAWNSQTEYFAAKSVVLKNGKIYVAIANSTNIEPEVTIGWESYWQNLLSWGKTVGNLYNQTDLWNALLKRISFDAEVASATGGYPLGAILKYEDTAGYVYFIKSLINNNTNVPTASNIKKPNSPEGTYYWQDITTEFNRVFLTNKNSGAVKTQASLQLNNNGFIDIQNAKGVSFPDTNTKIDASEEDTINIDANNVTIKNAPIIRIPNYNSMSLVINAGNTQVGWTASADGYVYFRARTGPLSGHHRMYINNAALIDVDGGNAWTGAFPPNSLLCPVQKGDYIRAEQCVVYFFPYR